MAREKNAAEVSVVGQGYVGLELSMALCAAGYLVTGIDISEARVIMLKSGISPVENVSSENLQRYLLSQSYSATSSFDSIAESRVVVICVPTPLDHSQQPDLSYLLASVERITPNLSFGTLIVNEATSYPGTLRNVIKGRVERIRPELEGQLQYGVAPERVSPGNGIPLSSVPRVVSGIDEDSKMLTKNFYESFCKEVFLVDQPEIAEMSKLLENSFRLVNIAFINEFSLLCRKLGIDSRAVIEAANTKPYGFMRFDPSPGIGGHCIPVDPIYLLSYLRREGMDSEFIDLAQEQNKKHPEKLLRIIEEKISPNELEKVLILGVSYKTGLRDTRESSAGLFAKALNSRGIQFGFFDPLVEEWMELKQAEISDDWKFVFILTAQEGFPIEDFIEREIPIFDFTGHFREFEEIHQI